MMIFEDTRRRRVAISSCIVCADDRCYNRASKKHCDSEDIHTREIIHYSCRLVPPLDSQGPPMRLTVCRSHRSRVSYRNGSSSRVETQGYTSLEIREGDNLRMTVTRAQYHMTYRSSCSRWRGKRVVYDIFWIQA